MSIENVKSFYEAVIQDQAIQQRFHDLNLKYQGMAVDAAKADAILVQDLLPLAKELGYEFTLAEIKAYGEEMQQASRNGELSFAELDIVAGGRGGGGASLICVLLGVNEGLNSVHGYGLCVLLGFNPAGGFCCLIGAGTKG